MPLITFHATGTQWAIETPSKLPARLQADIHERVVSFEQEFSRFLPYSPLSLLNTKKILRQPSPEMRALLEYGLLLYKKSHGLFNMSIGAQLEAQGYGTMQENSWVSQRLEDDIVIDEHQITIAEHIRLDFGGFAKGWLIDSLHNLLTQHAVHAHIINGGGDLFVGNKSTPIYIEDVSNSTVVVAKVILRQGALAVSSNGKRKWQSKDGMQRAHIQLAGNELDTVGSTQISVRAPSCALADGATTALLLASEDQRRPIAQALGVAYATLHTNVFSQSRFFDAHTY